MTTIPTRVVDIDILIGEITARGSGFGPSALKQVAEQAFSDPSVPFVMGCARLDNPASQRAFVKAGFYKAREFDDGPDGCYALMVRDRQQRD